MTKDNDSNPQASLENLPPARLPDGHQPVNTEILVRAAGQQTVETKVVQANQNK